MESIFRSVKDINTADRQALEHVIGQPLLENQHVVIQVVNMDAAKAEQSHTKPSSKEPPALPEWCNVYEGLSDAEIANIEGSIVRSEGSRSIG